jgi:hypothetical protein
MAGPDAVEKAMLLADLLFDRLAQDGVSFADDQRLVECVGAGVLPGMSAAVEPVEVAARRGAQ